MNKDDEHLWVFHSVKKAQKRKEENKKITNRKTLSYAFFLLKRATLTV